MDRTLIRLVNTVKDHSYVPYEIEGQTWPKLVCKGPHEGFAPSTCWKADVEQWLKDNATEADVTTVDSVTTTDLAQKILSELDEGAMLTSFIFLAEGIDTGGQRAVYSDGMPDIAVHQEMGMLHWALKRCEMHMEGKN